MGGTYKQSITCAFEWVPANNPILCPAREVAWQGSPDEYTMAINVDDSCQGNPGRGGFGGILRDHVGSYIFGFFGHSGHTKILHAELLGLLHGLQACWEEGFRRVIVYSDSLLAVQLVNDGVQAHHHYANEVHPIQDLLANDWYCSIRHTLREGNQYANFFAKRGALLHDRFTMVRPSMSLLWPCWLMLLEFYFCGLSGCV